MITRALRPVIGVTLWFVISMITHASESLVYFGTTSEKNTSEGIYVARFDSDTGKLSPATLAAKITSPTFINFHLTKPVLYSTGEQKGVDGKTSGIVEAFTVDPATGQLTPLNQQPSGGGALCYIQADAAGRTALGAAYGDGFVVSFPLQTDGKLSPHVSLVRHSGSGPNKQRQEAAHAHCIDLDPANRFALAADLGTDEVLTYQLSPAAGTIVQQPKRFHTKPGAGPRHVAFDQTGRHVYIINELDATLIVADYDSETGRLKESQTVPLLPPDFKGTNTAGEIVIHPSGKFLYASNRGFDSLALFAIETATGKLTFVEHMREGIKHPRHFAIDPTGHWLLCANRDDNTITIYQIAPETGRLSKTSAQIQIPMPTCVKFYAP
jgi:6-phosphogluconolactonase